DKRRPVAVSASSASNRDEGNGNRHSLASSQSQSGSASMVAASADSSSSGAGVSSAGASTAVVLPPGDVPSPPSSSEQPASELTKRTAATTATPALPMVRANPRLLPLMATNVPFATIYRSPTVPRLSRPRRRPLRPTPSSPLSRLLCHERAVLRRVHDTEAR